MNISFTFSGSIMRSAADIPSKPPLDKEDLFESQAFLADTCRPFLVALVEGRVAEPSVGTFLATVDSYTRTHHLGLPLDFPPDNPVEEVAR